MKMRTMGVMALLIGAVELIGLGGLDAQAARQRERAPRIQNHQMSGNPGSVGQILRMRERLELTDEQVRQLEQLEGEQVESRRALQDEMRDLQSQVRAGELSREDLRDQLSARRDAARDQNPRDAFRGQLEGILNQDQLDQFNRSQRRAPGPQARNQRGRRNPGIQGRRGGGRATPGVRRSLNRGRSGAGLSGRGLRRFPNPRRGGGIGFGGVR